MDSSSPIRKLPAELLTQIYLNFDNVGDANHLARTFKTAYLVWKRDTYKICRAILPRCIPSYDRTREAADAYIQGYCRMEDGRAFLDRHGARIVASVFGAQLTLYMSRTATLQLKLFEEYMHCRPVWMADPHELPFSHERAHQYQYDGRLTSGEKRRFRYYYLKLWTLSAMPPESARETMQSMNGLQRRRLQNFAKAWMGRWHPHLYIALMMRDNVWDQFFTLVYNDFGKDLVEAWEYHATCGSSSVRRDLKSERCHW